jgi:hypothetical protein
MLPFLQYSAVFFATASHKEQLIKSVSYSPLEFLNPLGIAKVILDTCFPLSVVITSGSLTSLPTRII